MTSLKKFNFIFKQIPSYAVMYCRHMPLYSVIASSVTKLIPPNNNFEYNNIVRVLYTLLNIDFIICIFIIHLDDSIDAQNFIYV